MFSSYLSEPCTVKWNFISKSCNSNCLKRINNRSKYPKVLSQKQAMWCVNWHVLQTCTMALVIKFQIYSKNIRIKFIRMVICLHSPNNAYNYRILISFSIYELAPCNIHWIFLLWLLVHFNVFFFTHNLTAKFCWDLLGDFGFAKVICMAISSEWDVRAMYH